LKVPWRVSIFGISQELTVLMDDRFYRVLRCLEIVCP